MIDINNILNIQSMDLNRLGKMLGLGCGGFLIEDAIFLTEKVKDFLRSRLGFSGDPILYLISRCVGKHHLRVRDFMQLSIRDYVIVIIIIIIIIHNIYTG